MKRIISFAVALSAALLMVSLQVSADPVPNVPKTIPGLDTILPKLRQCTQDVANGHDKWCKQSTPASIGNKITEDHMLRISVKYERRPLGGILSVTADLMPAFVGVGLQARPIDSKSASVAVDALEPEQVEEISRELVLELSKGYAYGKLMKTITTAANEAVSVASIYNFSPHTLSDGHDH